MILTLTQIELQFEAQPNGDVHHTFIATRTDGAVATVTIPTMKEALDQRGDLEMSLRCLAIAGSQLMNAEWVQPEQEGGA